MFFELSSFGGSFVEFDEEYYVSSFWKLIYVDYLFSIYLERDQFPNRRRCKGEPIRRRYGKR